MAANFIGQLFKVETRKDGGGRLQMDFGADAIPEIQKIQNWNGKGGVLFALAIVPVKSFEHCQEDFAPDENGEIVL